MYCFSTYKHYTSKGCILHTSRLNYISQVNRTCARIRGIFFKTIDAVFNVKYRTLPLMRLHLQANSFARMKVYFERIASQEYLSSYCKFIVRCISPAKKDELNKAITLCTTYRTE